MPLDQEKMLYRAPPNLLADRLGIFISSYFSYRKRSETQQSNFQRVLQITRSKQHAKKSISLLLLILIHV